MRKAFRRHPGSTIGVSRRTAAFPLVAGQGLCLAIWIVLPALSLFAVGCGDKKAKESTAVAEAETSQEEEKEAPAQAQAPAPKKRHKAVEKPIEPAPPAASTRDLNKWGAPDLTAALLRRDTLFVPAAVLFGMRGQNDPKRAADLDVLVHKVAAMKDDAVVPLALPAGAFAAVDDAQAVSPAKPGGAPGAAPAMPGNRRGFRFGIGPK